jgi:NADH-quinone oxidoreductase E subunit
MRLDKFEMLTDSSMTEIKRLKGLYPQRNSAILMALHVIHRQFGYLDSLALREAAEIMELPYIDFQQAASFYTLFPNKVVGKYHIQVCRTLSCQLRGAEGLSSLLMQKLGIKMGEVTPDGLFSLTEVECLGSCGTAPVMQINETYYENLTQARVDEILNDLREKA